MEFGFLQSGAAKWGRSSAERQLEPVTSLDARLFGMKEVTRDAKGLGSVGVRLLNESRVTKGRT